MIVCVIPARLASTRLPNKLLLAETGKPLIVHTIEAVYQCELINRVAVAVDSIEMYDAVSPYAQTFFTGEHKSGTDRVASVVERNFPTADLVVNVQGDEPEISAESLRKLIRVANTRQCDMATLACPLADEDYDDPSAVKVSITGGYGKWFGRKWVPGSLRHVGVYAYVPTFLEWFQTTPQTEGELSEGLEQLRALEFGLSIRVATVQHAYKSIDTRENYEQFVKRYRG